METNTEKEDKRKYNGGMVGKAGRKESTDPKIPVQVYITTSIVERAGGIEQARAIAIGAIEKAGRKTRKTAA